SLPGSYWTRHRRTCSPPTAWIRTPSTNSYDSRPFHVRNGPRASGIGREEPLAAVRGQGLDRDRLVEDDALAVARRLLPRLERPQHALGRRGHLRDPDADRVVDRGGDRRRLRVVRHLADRLGAERAVGRRVLEDDVVELGEVLHRGGEIGAEFPAAVLRRRIVRVALLEQPEPQAHHGAALDLPLDERRVDRPP